MNHSVVLFDGVCNLCNSSVQFIIRRDSKGRFRFASLQSEIGKKLLDKFHFSAETSDTIILIENDKLYIKSTAALRIARKLDKLWFLLYAFIILPTSFRDLIYDFIARNRYKWFGKNESCMLPQSNGIEIDT